MLSDSPASGGAPEVPARVRTAFGARVALAEAYAELLATAGIERGLLGPREVPRLWSRHLGNCAVLTDLLPPGAAVVDVGSGAGLPGIVLAIRRADVTVTCVESLHRRVMFLEEAIQELSLGDQVSVVHGRVEDSSVRRQVSPTGFVTARAVAPLDRLVRWSWPILDEGGQLLAMKGASAADELAAWAPRPGARMRAAVVELASLDDEEPVRVTVVEKLRGRG